MPPVEPAVHKSKNSSVLDAKITPSDTKVYQEITRFMRRKPIVTSII
jgi:hypothetical protein